MPAPGPDKALCNAQRPNQPKGVLCKRVAGHGTDHLGVGRCSRHGGSTETHKRSAEVELARIECETLGISIETTPAEALIRSVWAARGDFEFYQGLVRELPIHPEPDEYIDGEDGEDGHWERGQPGVYGRTYHVSGVPTGEAKRHILVQLYEDAQKRLADFASAALKAGVEERALRIAEADAVRINDAQMKACEAMGWADRWEEYRGHFNAFLAASDEPAHLGAARAA